MYSFVYSFFNPLGLKMLIREWVAAAIALLAGSIIFGLMCLKFNGSDEGATLVAAMLVAAPVAVIILQQIRLGKMHFPRRAKAKDQPAQKEENEWPGSFLEFWKSLDPEERQGLQWLTSLMAANALNDMTGGAEPPFELSPGDFEELVKAHRERKILMPLRGDRTRQIFVKVEHIGGRITYTLERKDT